MITIFLIFPLITAVFGCYGGASVDETTIRNKYKLIKDPVERNEKHAWGGFQPPPDVLDKWKKWMADFSHRQQLEESQSPSDFAHERGPGSGWPSSWNGLGAGSGGVPPPPWAYGPVNTGLPQYCYLPLKLGTTCSNPPEERWAFNPYTNVCEKFTYNGCNENKNNFKTSLYCEASCMQEPISGCDPDTEQELEMNDDSKF